MKRAISSGLVDSAFAALATFSVTIYGARVLSPETFGFFALFWAAFLMAAIVPAQMWFQPWEVAAAALAVDSRTAFLRQALSLGVLIALVSGITAAAVAVSMAQTAAEGVAAPFAISLVMASIISPIQDFVRRILHVGDHSGRAAVVSSIQFVTVLGALFGLRWLDVPTVWIPLTALAVANSISTAVGLMLAHNFQDTASMRPEWRTILRSGSWLLLLGLVVPLGGLVVNWLIITISGPDVMGLAEAARVVGRPIVVVTTGLGLALRPRSFEAVSAKDPHSARTIRRAFSIVAFGGGILYTTAVSVNWPGNVMMELVPIGFRIPGLVAAICVANLVVAMSYPRRYELIALRREGYTTFVEFVGQGLKMLSALGAAVIGAFVIPLGEVLLGAVRATGYGLGMREGWCRNTPNPLDEKSSFRDLLP